MVVVGVAEGVRLGEDGRERVGKKSCLRSNEPDEPWRVATKRKGGTQIS